MPRAIVARRLSTSIVAFVLVLAGFAFGPMAPRHASAQASVNVTDMVPTDGPISPGTTVTLIGQGFTTDGFNSAVTSVTFGTKEATVLDVASDNEMHVQSPDYTVNAGGDGPSTVHVVVSTTLGSSQSPKDFTFHPEISAVSPNSGLATGHDQAVQITGVGFEFNSGGALSTTAPTVCFGKNGSGGLATCNQATVCPAVTPPDTACNTKPGFSDTQVWVDPPQAPNGNPGTTDVYVKVNGVASDPNINNDGYNYKGSAAPPSSQPTINNVDTQCCSKGNTVNITGTNYAGVDKVSFGNPTCGQAEVDADFSITAASPTPGGAGNIQATAPAHAIGTNLLSETFDIGVHNTSTGAPNQGWSSCSGGGTPTPPATSTDQYTYDVPTVTGLTATSGPTTGGTDVGIDGNVGGSGAEQFKPDDTSVDFGGTPACANPHCTLQGDGPSGHQRIHVTSPPHCVGTVHVHVTNSAGPSDPIEDQTADQFTYVAGRPSVSGVSPNTGGTAGGTVVTITGSQFQCADTVSVGDPTVTGNHISCGAAANQCHVDATDGTVTFTTPSHGPGTVDLYVHTGGGWSMATPADQFTFQTVIPHVSGVTPGFGTSRWGNPAGGYTTKVTGSGFFAGGGSCAVSAVSFGSSAASMPVSNCSDTQFTVTVPKWTQGDPSYVDVRVTAGGQQSPVTSNDLFRYTHGYNILTGSGGIYSFGDATYWGNMIDHGYPGPSIGLSEMPDGQGYQILNTGGGLYSFGDAVGHYYGNLIDHGYPGPAVAIGITRTGNGYSILTGGGGLYSFGDAQNHYYGNLIDHGYPGRAVSFAWTKTGLGYWILTDSGAIYSFGDATYYGNLIDGCLSGRSFPGHATSLTRSAAGSGYQILTQEGGIYSCGDAAAEYYGNLIDHGYPTPGVAFSTTP